jgi:putative transposase
VLDRVPKKKQPQVQVWLRELMDAPTREKAAEQKGKFQGWCEGQGFGEAGRLLDEDWERLVAYYDFPKEHWKHLRTTNPEEGPFASVRLRTTAAKRYKRVENAAAMIWKLLMVAEQRFRNVNAPERMPQVAAGARYINGGRQRGKHDVEKAAA